MFWTEVNYQKMIIIIALEVLRNIVDCLNLHLLSKCLSVMEQQGRGHCATHGSEQRE